MFNELGPKFATSDRGGLNVEGTPSKPLRTQFYVIEHLNSAEGQLVQYIGMKRIYTADELSKEFGGNVSPTNVPKFSYLIKNDRVIGVLENLN